LEHRDIYHRAQIGPRPHLGPYAMGAKVNEHRATSDA